MLRRLPKVSFYLSDYFIPLAGIAVVLIIFGLTRILGLEQALFMLLGLCIVSLLTLLAYRFPLSMFVMIFAAALLLDQEARTFLPYNIDLPQVGPMLLRYFDPILLAIVLATIVRLAISGRRLGYFSLFYFPSWLILLGWFGFQVLNSLTGLSLVNALGEFRTYYQHLLIVAYVVTFFDTSEKQWRLFKLLMALALAFIPWAAFAAIASGRFNLTELSVASRHITSAANLAMLWGVVSIFVADRYKTIVLNNSKLFLIAAAFIFLTVINSHRSVWLTACIVIALLFMMKTFTQKRQLQVMLVLVLLLVAVNFMPTLSSRLVEFVNVRATAITSFQEDATASWRYQLWLEALDRIAERPLTGFGFGQHFQLRDSQGLVITTSPHNQYITLAYHAGMIGLGFYLLFLLQCLYRFLTQLSIQQDRDIRRRTMLTVSLIVLLGSGVYHVAYTFDFFTWFYLSLGLSVSATHTAGNYTS